MESVVSQCIRVYHLVAPLPLPVLYRNIVHAGSVAQQLINSYIFTSLVLHPEKRQQVHHPVVEIDLLLIHKLHYAHRREHLRNRCAVEHVSIFERILREEVPVSSGRRVGNIPHTHSDLHSRHIIDIQDLIHEIFTYVIEFCFFYSHYRVFPPNHAGDIFRAKRPLSG